MSHSFEAPHGELEARIAQIWSELLGVDRIGRNDDFFELGGHSVLAMGMLSRLRSTLNADVSLTELFRRSRLMAFAEAVHSAGGASVAPGSRGDGTGAVRLSPAQERIWFMERLAPGDAAYHLHWALRLTGPLVPAAMEQALREVQRRHDVLRYAFTDGPDGPIQSPRPYDGGVVVRFDLSDLERDERERRLAEMAREHARTPFNLEQGPPIRVYMIRLASDEWAVLLNMHHLVSDGMSLDQFFRDVEAFYSAFISGEPCRLEPLGTQYADVAAAMRARLESPRFEEDVQFWKRQLRAPLETQQLEPDFPRPQTPSYLGDTRTHNFPPALLASLQALSREEGVTLFVTLLSAFQILLHRWNGKDEVVIGTDIANRSDAGAVGLLGLFVNQLVLRIRLAGQLSFREVLRRTRRVVLHAMEHQDVPFDHLVRELAPAREVGSNPLFQIMFVLHSAVVRSVHLPRLRVEPIAVSVESSPFDLSVSFAEIPSGELRVDCRYRMDLFRGTTIDKLIAHLETLLNSAVANPDGLIGDLQTVPAEERAASRQASEKRKASRLERLLDIRAREIDGSTIEMVRIDAPFGERAPPLRIRPAVPGVVLERFARMHASWIEDHIHRHGAVLFRGFGIDSADRLQAVTDALTRGAMDYTERSSPRSRLKGNVFTSTDHPADQAIVLHNEQSYTLNWPMRILFSCIHPSAYGGGTPIADSRRVLARLSRETVAAFEEKGVLYVRNYEPGIGVSWQDAFQTDDPAQVEAQCSAAGIECEWRPGNRLGTRQRRPAIRRHPVTGERVWFNHAYFFNVASLGRELRDAFTSSDSSGEHLPFHTSFGDGTPIPETVLDDIRAALDKEAVTTPWEPGDLLVLDNMLAAHGREPYAGQRDIAVTMAEPYQFVTGSSELPARAAEG